MRSFHLGLVALGLCLCLAAHGEDKDKRRLFNTFFLDGDRVTYVLIMNQDRTCALYSPDGQVFRGTYVASDKEIGFPYEGGQRHFEYDFDGKDVKFKPTKKDRPQAGLLIGSLPPIGADSKAVFICLQNWKDRGLPTEPNPPANVAVSPTDIPPVPPPVPVVQPVMPPITVTGTETTPAVQVVRPVQSGPKDITGTYAWTDANGRPATLRLREGGTFDYVAPDGHRDGGTYLYLNGELNLDSGFWRRHFQVTESANGLSFNRRETDVPKLGDGLGEMVPLQGSVEWARTPDAVAVTPPGPMVPVEPVRPPPLTTPQQSQPVPPRETPVTAPEPVTPPEVQPRPTSDQPGTQVAQRKPEGLAQLVGAYTHRPNPLVSETWTLSADGQFEYRDSNGAKVTGTATLKDGVLRLQAGEVVRQFTVSVEETGTLTFARAPEDAPRILNDLASMSPSVLKNARYDKK